MTFTVQVSVTGPEYAPRTLRIELPPESDEVTLYPGDELRISIPDGGEVARFFDDAVRFQALEKGKKK